MSRPGRRRPAAPGAAVPPAFAPEPPRVAWVPGYRSVNGGPAGQSLVRAALPVSALDSHRWAAWTHELRRRLRAGDIEPGTARITCGRAREFVRWLGADFPEMNVSARAALEGKRYTSESGHMSPPPTQHIMSPHSGYI